MMNLIHIWLEGQSFIEQNFAHIRDLNIKATDFTLHPPFQLIQASYDVWWQLLLCHVAENIFLTVHPYIL